ncbi:hypothetical protein [Pseudomonas sp. CF161]|uniref:hypothetical protein n=1 Tax=Pseudomonas sp. CF161 TaxID=911241 RepID=UPI0004143550|nr:hypothetical protein [Pseudomonas sp. CF161]
MWIRKNQRPTPARRYREWGGQFIAVGIDVSLFRQAALNNLARYRQPHSSTSTTPSSRTC